MAFKGDLPDQNWGGAGHSLGAGVGRTSHSPPASAPSSHGGPGSSCPAANDSRELAQVGTVAARGPSVCSPRTGQEPQPLLPSQLPPRGLQKRCLWVLRLSARLHAACAQLPGLLQELGTLNPSLTSILCTASSMAADVAAISLSTTAPSSSCRTSRLLGFSSWEEDSHTGRQITLTTGARESGPGTPDSKVP